MRCKLRSLRVRLNQVLIFGLVVALFSVVLPMVSAAPAAAALTEQQKADRVAPLIRALEDYAADHGTYAVSGGGWRGGGQGWFGYSNGVATSYPDSVAQVLIDGGYLASGEGWETSSTQFMVYLCGSRAAVFAQSTVAVASGDVSTWSGCTQNPVTRYNRKYYEVTATLADVEAAKQIDVAVGALEAYAMDHGTYAVAGGGSRGRGIGWFSYSNNRADSYPKSVGQVLVEQGYLPAGEGWETSSTKYLVYLCNGRAAVYSASQVMISADDAAAWSGCYQGPTTRPHYRVTASAADLTTANLVGQIVDALEDYAADNGTYAVANSGWRGGGQGWFGYSNGRATSYPASVAQTLIDGGYLPAGTTFTSPTTRFMIYRCGDRAAIFAMSAVTVAAEDQADWTGCTQNPITRYNRPHYQVTSTVAEAQAAAAAEAATAGHAAVGEPFAAPRWDGAGVTIVGHRVTAEWSAVDDPNIGQYRVQYGLGGPGTWSTLLDRTERVANFLSTVNRKQCVMIRAEAANGRLASDWSEPRCGALGDVSVDVSVTGSPINVGQTNWSVVLVDLTNTDLGAVQVELTYNPDVVEPIGCTVDHCNPVSPGIIRMAAYNQDIWADDFQLGGVNFKAIGTGSSDLAVTVEAVGDSDGWEPPAASQGGSISVPAMLLPPAVIALARAAQVSGDDGAGSSSLFSDGAVAAGVTAAYADANCDGILDIRDAVVIAQLSVGREVAIPSACQSPDATGDGEVNILDAYEAAKCAVRLVADACPATSLAVPEVGQPVVTQGEFVAIKASAADGQITEVEYRFVEAGESQERAVGRTFAAAGKGDVSHVLPASLPPGEVCVRARAKNNGEAGDSGWSDAACTTMSELYSNPPQSPVLAGFTLHANADSASAELSWTPSERATTYRLMWSDDGNDATWSQQVVSSTSRVVPVSLASGIVCAWVVAIDASGLESAPSERECASYIEPTIETVSVDNARPQWIGQASIVVSIKDRNDNGSYRVDLYWGSDVSVPTDGTYTATWADFNRVTGTERQFVLGEIDHFIVSWENVSAVVPFREDEQGPLGGYVGRTRSVAGIGEVASWIAVQGLSGDTDFEVVAVDTTGLRSDPLTATIKAPDPVGPQATEVPSGPTEYPATIVTEGSVQAVPAGDDPAEFVVQVPPEPGEFSWDCDAAAFHTTPYFNQVSLTWTDTQSHASLSFNADLTAHGLDGSEFKVSGHWSTANGGQGLLFEDLEPNTRYTVKVRRFEGSLQSGIRSLGACEVDITTDRAPGAGTPTGTLDCAAVTTDVQSFESVFIDWAPIGFVDGYEVRVVEGNFRRVNDALAQPSVASSRNLVPGSLLDGLRRDTTHTAVVAARLGESTVSAPCLVTFETLPYGPSLRTVGVCLELSASAVVIDAHLVGCYVVNVQTGEMGYTYGGGVGVGASLPGPGVTVRVLTSNTPFTRDWAGWSLCGEVASFGGVVACSSFDDPSVTFSGFSAGNGVGAMASGDYMWYIELTTAERQSGIRLVCANAPEYAQSGWCP